MNHSFGEVRSDDTKQKERQRAKSMRQEEIKEDKWYPGKYLKIWVTKI